MKRTVFLLAVLLSFSGAFCQTSDAELDAMINLLGVQKREAVGKLVQVSGKDSIAFWKIFDEYQIENKKVATDRMKLYERTAIAYENMTPQRADSLASQYFENRQSQERRLEEYYQKIKAATNATVGFEFYQAEVYLLTMLRGQIMEQVPTYGEVLKNKKK